MSTNTILASAPLTATGYHLKATGTTLGQSLIWDNGTNVGIGNTNTSYTLDVSGTGRFTSSLGVGSAGAYASTTLLVRSNSATSTNWAFIAEDNATNQIFGIRNNGNVAIGTGSPSYKLHVSNNTNGFITRFTGGTSSDVNIGIFGSTAGAFGSIGTESNHPFNIFTNGTDRMSITSGGEVLVGTASGYNSMLSVKSPASFGTSNFRSDSATAAGTGWTHFYGTSSSNSVANILIYGNGNVVNANNSYGPISDIKLKENIIDTTPKLDKLMQVRIVNYNLKSDLGYETYKQIGVIAQELEQVFPSLVDENKDFNSEGNDLGTTTKSVKMSVFVPILIKAMQEQQIQIQNLQEQINILAK